jgi:hypothetical protein
MKDRDPFSLLNDSKRMRHIRDAGDTREMALDFRVECLAILEVLLLPGERRWLVRDLVPLDHAFPGRYAQPRAVILNVPSGCVEDLPNAL